MISRRPGAIPRPWARGSRPWRWKHGPDPRTHELYTAYRQQRNQALFRQEPWHLTFEEWQEIWQPWWGQRGRTRGSRCMSRQDWDGPWSRDNVMIVTREEHARMQALARARARGTFA